MLKTIIDLKLLGFVDAGTCNCNGTHNRKYKRSEYLIYITKTRFKVKKHGNTVKAYTDIENLESYLRSALSFLFAGK